MARPASAALQITSIRSAIVPFALILVVACSGEPQERIPLGEGGAVPEAQALPPEIQSRLDEANEAYRMREYGRALTLFEEVVRDEPELAAGWYGVGMTHTALGNSAAADSAMARVHSLAPEMPLEHPSGEAPVNPHPVVPGR